MQYRPPHHARPEENRNLLLAVVLSMLVVGGWQYFYEAPRRAQEAAFQKQQVERHQAETPAAAPNPGAAPMQTPAEPAPVTRAEALAQGARIAIESGELKGSFAASGGRIDDVTLTGYKETVAPDSPDVVLLAPSATKASYFAELGWASGDTSVPGPTTEWQTEGQKLSPSSPVTLRWSNPAGVTFETVYQIDPHFMFTITQRVINKASAPVTLAPYGLISREVNEDPQHFAILHEGPLGVLNGGLEEIDYKKLNKEGDQTYSNVKGSWLGMTDKYWLTALIPVSGQQGTARFRKLESHGKPRYQADFTGQPITVQPGETSETMTRLFAGAKRVDLLDSYAKNDNILLFDRAVDFGRLYVLTRPLFRVLHWFYQLVGNFGVAILLLTVCVKAIMFPLANKSYSSMAQMKKLMPQMNELKEKYGDDRLKMNQEVIALYKRERVNPASGCLPMLVQIPIFWALYKVLFITIEMRHAPFFGWIRDLSVPDPTNIFTLFGLIPWDAHIFSFHLHVGIWPMLMAGTMLIQQKLNPKPTDQTQAMIMGILPWMFLFMFSSFPAGLVIYWTWSNTLSILQQYAITRRHKVNSPPAEPAAA